MCLVLTEYTGGRGSAAGEGGATESANQIGNSGTKRKLDQEVYSLLENLVTMTM